MVAQKTVVTLLDDLDGSEAEGTITFALNGVQYDIDLSKKNSDKLTKALAPYLASARKVSTMTSPRTNKTSTSRSRPNPADVRAWARSEGIEVKDKGRVPAELIVKFQAAGQ
jgi:hypothetical protein